MGKRERERKIVQYVVVSMTSSMLSQQTEKNAILSQKLETDQFFNKPHVGYHTEWLESEEESTDEREKGRESVVWRGDRQLTLNERFLRQSRIGLPYTFSFKLSLQTQSVCQSPKSL